MADSVLLVRPYRSIRPTAAARRVGLLSCSTSLRRIAGTPSTPGSVASIAEEFARAGVTLHPAKKADRITGWQRMRRMLAEAGQPDRPGLYVSRACEYFWATVPYLARDQRRVEDCDSGGPDHAADCCRYGLLYEHPATELDLRWAT